MSDNILTQERLKELLSYDPETGVFVRIKQTSSNALIGDVAGTPQTKGYWYLCVDGTRVLAHRAAWLYMTGTFPPDQIDHINQIKNDNRFVNLRAVTQSENAHNQNKYKCNKSGYKGVYYCKQNKAWRANIRINNVTKHLGGFFTPEEASAAYLAAQKIYHPTCPTI